jgi:hypothetical protein
VARDSRSKAARPQQDVPHRSTERPA